MEFLLFGCAFWLLVRATWEEIADAINPKAFGASDGRIERVGVSRNRQPAFWTSGSTHFAWPSNPFSLAQSSAAQTMRAA